MGRTANFAAMLIAVCSTAPLASPAAAADVSAERLLNAPQDPQNWLPFEISGKRKWFFKAPGEAAASAVGEKRAA